MLDLIPDLLCDAADDVRRFVNRWRPVTPERLVYAATDRCRCGAGLAYLPNTGATAWDCSRVLLGTEDLEQPHAIYQFAFFEVKSENQPSARGSTTRPR